jgi:hypothetical protein
MRKRNSHGDERRSAEEQDAGDPREQALIAAGHAWVRERCPEDLTHHIVLSAARQRGFRTA